MNRTKESEEVYSECQKLIKYGAGLVNVTVKQMKLKKDFDNEFIQTLDGIVVDLNGMHDSLNEIEKSEHSIDYDDPMQLGEIMNIGDLYNNWMFEFTAKIMPQLESIKDRVVVGDTEGDTEGDTDE